MSRRSGFGEMSKNVKMGLAGAGVILFIVIIIVMMTKSSFGGNNTYTPANPNGLNYISGSSKSLWKYTDNPNDPDCANNWNYYQKDGKTLISGNIPNITMEGDKKNWCATIKPMYVSVFPKGPEGMILMKYDGKTFMIPFPDVNHSQAVPVKSGMEISYTETGKPMSEPIVYYYNDLVKFAKGGNKVCIDILPPNPKADPKDPNAKKTFVKNINTC